MANERQGIKLNISQMLRDMKQVRVPELDKSCGDDEINVEDLYPPQFDIMIKEEQPKGINKVKSSLLYMLINKRKGDDDTLDTNESNEDQIEFKVEVQNKKDQLAHDHSSTKHHSKAAGKQKQDIKRKSQENQSCLKIVDMSKNLSSVLKISSKDYYMNGLQTSRMTLNQRPYQSVMPETTINSASPLSRPNGQWQEVQSQSYSSVSIQPISDHLEQKRKL